MAAAKQDHGETVRLLLDRGASIEAEMTVSACAPNTCAYQHA